MGDRMFASEGDSLDVGHPGGGTGDRIGGHAANGDEAAGAVARRLHGRLDRHLWLLDRLRADPLHGELPELPELLETARRMLRDTDSLLLLSGQDPGIRPAGPRRVADVLAEAAAASEEPRRVDVAPAPAAGIAAAASVELVHVVAEVVDHTIAARPGGRVELVSRVEPHGGLTVEIVAEGSVHSLDPPRLPASAQRLTQRSRAGLQLHHPDTPPPPFGVGAVAIVYCPAGVVVVDEPVQPRPATDPYPSLVDNTGLRALVGSGAGNGHPNGNGHANGNGNGNGYANGNGASRAAAASVLGASAPGYTPSVSSQVDELFGPMLDLPVEPGDDHSSTPIFEAIASAWFKEGDAEPGQHPGDGAGAVRGQPGGEVAADWESPQDDEWRAAAERAARPDPTPTTATGLPRRRPGNQLVPPPLGGKRAPDNPAPERVPDRIRERLSTYQRGLRQGRHRAPGSDEDPAAW